MDGLALLDPLKRTPDIRHIPVHVISADDQAGLGLAIGAFGFTPKPVDRDVVVKSLDQMKRFIAAPDRRLLFVGGQDRLHYLLEGTFGAVTRMNDLKAIAKAKPKVGDSLVVEAAGLPVAALIDYLKATNTRAVVYADEALDADEERRLKLAVRPLLRRKAALCGRLRSPTIYHFGANRVAGKTLAGKGKIQPVSRVPSIARREELTFVSILSPAGIGVISPQAELSINR